MPAASLGAPCSSHGSKCTVLQQAGKMSDSAQGATPTFMVQQGRKVIGVKTFHVETAQGCTPPLRGRPIDCQPIHAPQLDKTQHSVWRWGMHHDFLPAMSIA